jgi:subtilisin family serine protease
MLRVTPISPVTLSHYSQSSYSSPAILASHSNPLDLVRLGPLMEQSSGRAETAIALIDGPVVANHPDLSSKNIREIPGRLGGTCTRASSVACRHGTFVAGILTGRRGSVAPSIAPDCTLLVRPIFAETSSENPDMPSATPEELATAITDCIDAGARIINLSAALVKASAKAERKLAEALNHSAKRGVIVVAAAGNQGDIGSSLITRHPWVIPIVACDLRGRPVGYSNFGNSIGRRGLSAPGHGITSLGADGSPVSFGGTSAAAPFVTGTAALLCSVFPNVSSAQVKFALLQGHAIRRAAIVPALLDAWAAYQILKQSRA